MIHGGLVDSRSWERQLPLRSELTLVMLDTRGFGRSWPAEPIDSIDDLVGDVVGVMDIAEIKQAHILGFSIGGFIAQAVALRHPERVAGLVLESTRAASSSVSPDRPATAVPSAAAHVQRAFCDDFRTREPQFMARYTEMAEENHARAVMPELIKALASSPTPAQLAQVAVPTSVVHARDDAAIPFFHGERLAAAIPGAKLIPFDDCGHSLHIERSEDFNQLLCDVVLS
jgi:3-oxoadipate enol-lactonase